MVSADLIRQQYKAGDTQTALVVLAALYLLYKPITQTSNTANELVQQVASPIVSLERNTSDLIISFENIFKNAFNSVSGWVD